MCREKRRGCCCGKHCLERSAPWMRTPMRKPLSLIVLLVVMIGFAAITIGQGFPQDYPQWRGRNRDGAASAFIEPKLWPDTLTRKWKVDVGEGYATPLLV